LLGFAGCVFDFFSREGDDENGLSLNGVGGTARRAGMQAQGKILRDEERKVLEAAEAVLRTLMVSDEENKGESRR
jgi:hypothetical protein